MVVGAAEERCCDCCGAQVLSLADCSVSDLCLPHFSRLQQLRELSLKGCRDVSDAGLAHLTTLSSLQVRPTPSFLGENRARLAVRPTWL